MSPIPRRFLLLLDAIAARRIIAPTVNRNHYLYQQFYSKILACLHCGSEEFTQKNRRLIYMRFVDGEPEIIYAAAHNFDIIKRLW